MAFTNNNDQIFSFVEPGADPNGSGTDSNCGWPLPAEWHTILSGFRTEDREDHDGIDSTLALDIATLSLRLAVTFMKA